MLNIVRISDEKHEGDATCIAYHNNQVFSGGADGTIKIWDDKLNLVKSLDVHETYIYAIAIHSSGKVYTSCCDGSVKFVTPPYDKENIQELFSCEEAIESMYIDNNTLYTGDGAGVVTSWIDDKMVLKYNLVEEVKSLGVEGNLIYTVRDLDVVVSEISALKPDKYSNKAVMPGKSPLCLLGPIVDGKHSYIAYADRGGKGLILAKNLPNEKFECVWKLADCHEMIINSICGNDKYLYSGGYDNTVKGWTDLDQKEPKYMGEVFTDSCVNAVCCGTNDNVLIAASDGMIRRAKLV